MFNNIFVHFISFIPVYLQSFCKSICWSVFIETLLIFIDKRFTNIWTFFQSCSLNIILWAIYGILMIKERKEWDWVLNWCTLTCWLQWWPIDLQPMSPDIACTSLGSTFAGESGNGTEQRLTRQQPKVESLVGENWSQILWQFHDRDGYNNCLERRKWIFIIFSVNELDFWNSLRTVNF